MSLLFSDFAKIGLVISFEWSKILFLDLSSPKQTGSSETISRSVVLLVLTNVGAGLEVAYITFGGVGIDECLNGSVGFAESESDDGCELGWVCGWPDGCELGWEDDWVDDWLDGWDEDDGSEEGSDEGSDNGASVLVGWRVVRCKFSAE